MRPPIRSRPVRAKKPTVGRFLCVALLALAGDAAAAPPLTAEDAVALALARPEIGAIADASGATLEADAEAASLWPEPSIGWDREHVFGSGEEAEDAVVVSAPLDLSGRRGLRADALRVRARGARRVADTMRARLAAEARARHAAVAHAQEHHAVLVGWVERLEALATLVDQRIVGGESARHEALMIAREQVSARARVEQAHIERTSRWMALEALTGPLDAGPWPRVEEHALPTVPAQAERLAERPDVQRLGDEIEAAELDLAAAGRGWVPGLELEAGYKTVDGLTGRRHGYVLGLRVALPVFDRGQADEARALARKARAEAERDLLLPRLEREVTAARARLGALVELARRFRDATERESAARLQAVQDAWLGGEATPSALLDAHRGVVEDAERVLELEEDAVAAALALELLLSGGDR